MTERVDDRPATRGAGSGTARPETADGTPGSITRRRLVTGSIGALGAVGLAACGGDDDSAGSGGTSQATSATTPATGSGGGSTSDASGGASGSTKLTALSDVPVGKSVVLEAGDQKVVVSQPSEGKVVAFSAVCTHQGCTVNGGSEIKCPCHGSKFDPATGNVLNGPATKPLPAVPVSVQDGQVVLDS